MAIIKIRHSSICLPIIRITYFTELFFTSPKVKMIHRISINLIIGNISDSWPHHIDYSVDFMSAFDSSINDQTNIAAMSSYIHPTN